MTTMESLIGLVNRIQRAWGHYGGGDNPFFPLWEALPSVAVVGGQSSGKSSVLESIVGRDFLPKGSGIVTRRPLVLQLHKTESGQQEYAEFLHLPKRRFTDFSIVCKEIQDETDRITGRTKQISNVPIHLSIYSPNVVNLTLIDLPGLTKVAVEGQPETIVEDIENMVRSYVEKPNCVILAISPANQDIATSDGIKLAREVDPSGERTFGVLTKLDLMDKGTNALDVLEGRSYRLQHPWVGIVNRSQADINKNVDMIVARRKEREYFATSPDYGHLASKMGSEYLAKLLSKDTMPPRRPASSQNSQTNNDIPLPLEGLPLMSTEGLYRCWVTLASLVERQARATGTNGQGQSSSTRGSSLDDFKKLDPPYFSSTSDPIEADAWIMKIEKFFDVIDCSEEQKAFYAASMLDKEADYWWRMTKRLLEDQGPIVWRQFREAFYKKYFPDSVRRQKVEEFVLLKQGDMTVAQYVAKFEELSRFAPQLIATKEEATLKFQNGLKPYLKKKISILKLSVYLEVVDRALIVEKDNEEWHQYREQQRKRSRNDGAHGNQAQKKFASSRNQNKGKATQNSDGICPTCGKNHGDRPCYREIRACFGCGKQGHMVRDCPKNKKFVFLKPKEENKEDKTEA